MLREKESKSLCCVVGAIPPGITRGFVVTANCSSLECFAARSRGEKQTDTVNSREQVRGGEGVAGEVEEGICGVMGDMVRAVDN